MQKGETETGRNLDLLQVKVDIMNLLRTGH
jgi:hypothetical protein